MLEQITYGGAMRRKKGVEVVWVQSVSEAP